MAREVLRSFGCARRLKPVTGTAEVVRVVAGALGVNLRQGGPGEGSGEVGDGPWVIWVIWVGSSLGIP